MMISSEVERADIPPDAQAYERASVVLVATACWSQHITRTTYAIAPNGVWDCTLRNEVRPIRRAALAV
jgi:hypothetical protein